MFTLLEGGFNLTVNELVTLDFSWLFMFCVMVTMNVCLTIRKFVNWCKKESEKESEKVKIK